MLGGTTPQTPRGASVCGATPAPGTGRFGARYRRKATLGWVQYRTRATAPCGFTTTGHARASRLAPRASRPRPTAANARDAAFLLVSGVWCLVSGVWCLVSGVWCLVSGVWCLVSGVWCLVSGVWCLVSGVWCLVSGVWCLVSGVWCLVSGVWCLVSGVWCLVSGWEWCGCPNQGAVRLTSGAQWTKVSQSGGSAAGWPLSAAG